ncbi:MAG: M1 family metallopeptidase [candidate division KSB1 bacterium]|nr:M1 family metallopeptidase [candidate division KSB1 bacterium]MDZ7275173.1 M1 family metallopeptidase [candidate division KSB1 bacterium]MDZ7287342.1 M1 family metallopeptidase [candidate division KSB1 bacterium]MDZ7299456.1 M1 family metallopeptidase [candidate division KSB1 bacterium]MDZ7305498.1 M1 family metallopeptidase [candidate division KSB1 bacterium]
MKHSLLLLACAWLVAGHPAAGRAQNQNLPNEAEKKFRQLYEEFRSPNVYRTASGAPGHLYWQQRADYDLQIELDDEHQRLFGTGTIIYHNQSPDALTYLWLQLDQNLWARDSDTDKTRTGSLSENMSFRELQRLHLDFDGGFKIDYVRDAAGRDLPFVINKTMMRVDLPQPLLPQGRAVLKLKWWYNINDRMKLGGRSGYEYFPADGNYLYAIAQFYPRMAVYNDAQGWQHKQFLGAGEFTLCFGDYTVSLTVPADHLVAATGELQNAAAVLTPVQRSRWQQAQNATAPVMIVTEDEARAAEKSRSPHQKTWRFHARQVRDFAFASSRKFLWDAMPVKFGQRTVMAMSFYPKEGNPLWQQYSTKVVAHTLRSYSARTFDYPYPVAISVHTNRIGMEYPMICFNGGRPEPDGTYSERTKYGMISVIIHEVGHNFFPMIVNSDERQWTWMDEGLNTFLQYLAEQEWEHDYPSRRGPPAKIVDYMKGDRNQQTPVMANSESLLQFGENAYAKPATALTILRETVMGRELFDFAFKTYAQRWRFKQPTPEDLFRTLEDASGIDLDWFWRGWFYSTDHVDVALAAVKWYRIDTQDPDLEKPLAKSTRQQQPQFLGELRDQQAGRPAMVERDPSLQDFYNKYDPFAVSILDRREYERYLSTLDEAEKQLLRAGYNYYELHFQNLGGLVTPLILEFEYDDGTREVQRLPAEIWRYNDKQISKVFATRHEIRSITLDPFLETADTDMSNNYWPPRPTPTRFQLFKQREGEPENPMQRQRRIEAMSQGETTRSLEGKSGGRPPGGE